MMGTLSTNINAKSCACINAKSCAWLCHVHVYGHVWSVAWCQLTSFTLSYFWSASLRDVSSSPDSLWLNILTGRCMHTICLYESYMYMCKCTYMYTVYTCTCNWLCIYIIGVGTGAGGQGGLCPPPPQYFRRVAHLIITQLRIWVKQVDSKSYWSMETFFRFGPPIFFIFLLHCI